MDETTPNSMPMSQEQPTPAPEQKPEQKKELTPEEKKAKRKEMFKRLGIVSGVVYLVLIVAIFAWATLAYEKELSVFDYLPVSQAVFSNFLFTLFNVLFGALLIGVLGFASVALIKNLTAKKEEVDKKKKWKRLSIFGAAGLFLGAVLWIAAIWFLGPRLVSEIKSGIVTDPANTLGLTAPIEITFDASYLPIDTDLYEILAYTWNFGDGEIANGKTVSHRYTKKGSADGRYTVVLTVDYQSGGVQDSVEFTVEISIQNELTSASFDATPDSGEIPLTVQFDASASYDPDGEIVAYDWDMDNDGRYDDAEGEEVEYTFEQEGSFEVSLRVTDNNGEYSTTSMTIEAGSVNGLRAVISSDANEDVYYLDEKYEFDGNDSSVREGSIVSYSWDFGDGTKTQSRTASHTYTKVGVYDVKLTIKDSDGNEDSTTLEITVVDEGAAPTADFKTTPTEASGTVPFKVVFDASTSSDPDNDIVQYEWDLDGDGETDDTGDTVQYTYTEVGTYEVTLTVTDSIGNIDKVTKEIEAVAQGIAADLQISTTNGEVPLTVSFDASGSSYKEGSIVSYEYNFGDGSDTYVGGSSVKYKYTSVGTFTASVTVVADDGSTDTDTVQIVVRPVALTACFTVNTDSGTAPLFVSVDPSCSEGTIQSYSWDFGDGELSFDRKPETHAYSKSGTYTITLEITSDAGIVDSFENTITVK